MIFGVRKISIIRLALVIIFVSGLLYSWQNGSFVSENLLAMVSQKETYYLYKFGKNFGIKNNLKKGSLGFEVKILQAVLKKEINPQLKITGYFYNDTEKSLKTFQQKYNLSLTGYLDNQTLEKINKIYLDYLCPQPIKEYQDFFL